jgi:RHS repeat-associated protein
MPQSDTGFEHAYTYAGYRYDRETGLYYLNARYYVPGIGRFLTKDGVIGDDFNIQTLNRYTYCQGDPVNNVDFTGSYAWALEGLVGFGLATSEFGIGDLILLGLGGYILYKFLTTPLPGLSSASSSQLSDNVVSNYRVNPHQRGQATTNQSTRNLPRERINFKSSNKKSPNNKKNPPPNLAPLVPISEILKPSNQNLITIGTIDLIQELWEIGENIYDTYKETEKMTRIRYDAIKLIRIPSNLA